MKQRGTENGTSAVAATTTAAAVIGVNIFIVGDNLLVEGVAVIGAVSGAGPTLDSLSGAREEQEIGFGLGFDLGFEFFDSESLSLDDLFFLEVLYLIFLFLFSALPLPVIIAALFTVGFTT